MRFPVAYSTLYNFIKKLENKESCRKNWTHEKRKGEYTLTNFIEQLLQKR